MNSESNLSIPLAFGVQSGMPSPVDEETLHACKTMQHALVLSWRLRRRKMSQAEAANELGMHPPVFSNVLRGIRHLPANKYTKFMEITGNTLLLQFLAQEMGKRIEPDEVATAQWILKHAA
jgi:hypothetical protein